LLFGLCVGPPITHVPSHDGVRSPFGFNKKPWASHSGTTDSRATAARRKNGVREIDVVFISIARDYD